MNSIPLWEENFSILNYHQSIIDRICNPNYNPGFLIDWTGIGGLSAWADWKIKIMGNGSKRDA
ncbi:MAG: hypothetical protein KAI29_27215 [Cyclobacteriaceae bacterium]|nr:hypothetical protein [Cyclobacteriaceae bacterium]